MSMNLDVCTDKALWNHFVKESLQGNIFCTTQFLDAWGHDYELLLVQQSERIQLGAVVVKRDGKPADVPFMYQGVLYDNAIAKLPGHKRIKKSLELVDFLLAELEHHYDRISFSLHHSFGDLRSFQWFHYHKPELGQFTVRLRYTGLIDLSVINDFDDYILTIRRNRRRDYRTALTSGLIIEESHDIDTLNRLHELTFKQQGIQRSERDEQFVRSIITTALSEGFGQLLVCRNNHGEACAATLFLHDNYYGYSMFAGTDPEFKDTGCGTYITLENIRRCKERGLQCWDFLGINSPKRGDFKTSFNAIPKPYFEVTWEKPK